MIIHQYNSPVKWRVFNKLNNMKVRILKKKNPTKLQRIWIKHLIEWIKLDTEYKTIRKYYIQSCKEKINYCFK